MGNTETIPDKDCSCKNAEFLFCPSEYFKATPDNREFFYCHDCDHIVVRWVYPKLSVGNKDVGEYVIPRNIFEIYLGKLKKTTKVKDIRKIEEAFNAESMFNSLSPLGYDLFYAMFTLFPRISGFNDIPDLDKVRELWILIIDLPVETFETLRFTEKYDLSAARFLMYGGLEAGDLTTVRKLQFLV